ncbi:HAD family hydrolase [Lampropedia puyangensis]|uniref:HAD family hydrolase n=1 Tax=Lampropedia puyangensis TaxID=1330072 RepID=A0A4S8EZY5_9BURK|nr:HAD-IA family hydrolase [Lampropedia puyangensis]THT99920.1 HAD family hydrolase [Lampropedia puyangensis]
MNPNTSSPRAFDMLAFDWDGTLFDSTAIIARSIQDAVRDVGGTPPTDEAARWVIGLELNAALAKAAPDVLPAAYPELARRYRYHYIQRQDDIALFTGALPMLHQLKEAGFILTVATGKSRRGLNDVLASHDLHGLFDDSRTADETAGKPNPLMLQEMMDVWSIPPERLLMIGDTSHDLQMAINAGCPSIAVTYGAHAAQGLEQYQPLTIAQSIAQLASWFQTHAFAGQRKKYL